MIPWAAAAGLCVGPVHWLTLGLSPNAHAVAVFVASAALGGSALAARYLRSHWAWAALGILGITAWYGIFATWFMRGIFDNRQTLGGVGVTYAIFLLILFEDLMRQARRDSRAAASGERAAVTGE
jgi:hypothetical protein